MPKQMLKNRKSINKVKDDNNIDFYEEIERPRRFIQRSNIKSISLNKSEKLHAIHKMLNDEKDNNCSEEDILVLSGKLNKLLMNVIENIKSSRSFEDQRRQYKLQIESSFISRVSYTPYKINEVYREKDKIFGRVLNSKLNTIKNIMTCLYLHPWYLMKIIDNYLIKDDDIVRIISDLYQYNSQIRLSYITSLALVAFKRDFKGVESIDEFKIKHMKNQEVEKEKIIEEEKAYKNKRKRKHKHGKELDDSDEKDVNDSDIYLGINEEENLSLFYKIFKIMLDRDAKTKRYKWILWIYILNKLFNKKITPDSDDERKVAYDILLENRDNLDGRGISRQKDIVLVKHRKEELLEFCKNIFDKIVQGKIDIEDGSHYFKLKEQTSKQNADESDDDPLSYEVKISPEIEYLIYEVYKTINQNPSHSHNSYKIHCMLIELIFEDVNEILKKFSKNLIAYINNDEKDIKWLKDKIENVHKVNIKNIIKVFEGYIIPGK